MIDEADSAVAHIITSFVVDEVTDLMSSDRLTVVTHHKPNAAQFLLGASGTYVVIVLLAKRQRGTHIRPLLLRNHDIARDQARSELML